MAEFKTKYGVGQEVAIFNGVSMQIEHDEVFAILLGPMPADGKETFNPEEPISKQMVKVEPKYQLQHHQGLLEEKILFESEEELKAFYKEFFS